jgi:hypothetical protein
VTLENAEVYEVELMARHEEIIGALYVEYARMFPDYADFWEMLACEEQGHATLIRELFTLAEDGTIIFSDSRFNVKAIETSIRFINTLIAEAANEVIEPLRAFSLAFDLENSMLEKSFLDIYESDDQEIRRVLQILQDGTTQHRKMIGEKLEQVKKGMPPIAPVG